MCVNPDQPRAPPVLPGCAASPRGPGILPVYGLLPLYYGPMQVLRGILSSILILSWALWLGGLAALVVLVLAMFDLDRLIGATTAPRMFRVFLIYSSVVAFVSCASAGLLVWMNPGRRGLMMLVCLVLALATIGWTGYYIHAMDVLRMQGQSQTPEFRSLHGQSYIPYLVQMVLLAVVGVMLAVGTGHLALVTGRNRAAEIDAV
jgi:hypothetical protein